MLPSALLALLFVFPAPDPRPTAPAWIGAPLEPAAAAQGRRAQVRERYRELSGAGDRTGLAGLWREHPDLVLYSIEEDLEAGLALWEASPEEPDRAAIGDAWGRALFGARIATAVTGQPIYHDYAAAFLGWDEDQRRAHRVQQRVYQRALGELEKDQLDHSGGEATVAREVWERALDLGDWWGVALGYEVEGRAHQRAGMHRQALTAYSQARLYFHQLGLADSELEVLRRLVVVSELLGAWPRSRALAEDALARARALGRAELVPELLAGRARAEAALGDRAAAEATARELEALRR